MDLRLPSQRTAAILISALLLVGNLGFWIYNTSWPDPVEDIVFDALHGVLGPFLLLFPFNLAGPLFPSDPLPWTAAASLAICLGLFLVKLPQRRFTGLGILLGYALICLVSTLVFHKYFIH